MLPNGIRKISRILLWGGIGAAVAAALLFLWSERKERTGSWQAFPTQVTFHEKYFTLEIARTEAEHSRGLGYRDTLCSRCGMLFLFDEPGEYAFWMKGMRFPLDIVWLRDDRVVHIERHVSADSQEVLRPPEAADSVLEVNAGEADSLNVGDRVEFR